jgi:preprotein translocase subunit SecG
MMIITGCIILKIYRHFQKILNLVLLQSIESAQKAVEEKSDELEKAASGDPGNDKPIAAIIGGTVGGFVALVIIIVFIIKNKKKKQNKSNKFTATSAPRQELWINKFPPEDNSPSTEVCHSLV